MVGHIGGRWDELLDWMEEHGQDIARFRDPNWYVQEYRVAHFHEFQPLLFDMMSQLPKEQIFAEGQLRRIVLGPIRNMAEVRDDVQLNTRGFFVDLTTPEGPVRSAGAPYKLSKTPWKLTHNAPDLGEGAGDWQRPVLLPRTSTLMQPGA